METLSNDFKKIFWIKFTKELIKNSEVLDINKLQELILLKEKNRFSHKREEIKLNNSQNKNEILKKIPSEKRNLLEQKRDITQIQEISKPKLSIPEPKLPEHLEYLKPTPTQKMEIDLWKLNPLINDNSVKTIEANPDEKVIVTGSMGTKPTNISLNKEEIDQIIKEFSKRAKIPIEEGIYRVALGNLVLSAIISEVIGSKFIIKKITMPVPVAQISSPRKPQLQQKTQIPQIKQWNDKISQSKIKPF